MASLLHHDYIIITSLLCHPYNFIITYFTSFLRHFYVIIRSLLGHIYKWRNCVIMSSLLPIITLVVSIIILFSPIITIITYYYIFETGQVGQLADEVSLTQQNMVAALWEIKLGEPPGTALLVLKGLRRSSSCWSPDQGSLWVEKLWLEVIWWHPSWLAQGLGSGY